MTRAFDAYYDPPETPGTTLTDDLINAVDALITCATTNEHDVEAVLRHIGTLMGIRALMLAEELPEYDAPTTDDISDDERKALEEATGNG